jgi:trans-2,3-dihydro-3-hydroxyanthranilate isomerase
METQLEGRPFFVGERYSIADIAYAYTHVAHEAQLDLAPYPKVRGWHYADRREGYTMCTRRHFLQLGASGLTAAVAGTPVTAAEIAAVHSTRRLHFVQIDVFASQRLQGNPLAVFTDARGLSDLEMQAIARETRLEETTFILPRDRAVENTHGVRVRIFNPERELPFAGHPTLGTAMVIRNRIVAANARPAPARQVVLDLQVGSIPVAFTNDADGHVFGEMHQKDPTFGRIHDRETVAGLMGIKSTDISDDAPIQTVSTGLPFAIVPIKERRTLQSLRPDQEKIRAYVEQEPDLAWLYYVTRDTQDPTIGLRARGIYPVGEDPATGSASGCTAAWMVRYGLANTDQTVHIEQGVEINRPSQIFVRAGREGDKVLNVHVGGNAVEIAEGEYSL